MKMKRYIAVALAAHLFELETDTISQDPEFHFEFNEWLDKYGEGSIKHQGQLTSSDENEFNAAAIEKIADALQIDFASGYWVPTDEDIKEQSFYQVYMPEIYGGLIVEALDKQLAMLTGVGYQQELFEV